MLMYGRLYWTKLSLYTEGTGTVSIYGPIFEDWDTQAPFDCPGRSASLLSELCSNELLQPVRRLSFIVDRFPEAEFSTRGGE